MRVGSMCSGGAGLEMAVEMLWPDAELAWLAENDKHAAALLEARFPGVPNLGDLTTVDWSEVEPVDVVTAGFPCQDLSCAGRGVGIVEGNRSGLWYVIERAVRGLRPRLVLLENVSAIVGRRPGLDVVLAGLAEGGFDAQWATLRASDVGAPHRRERWFCVATNAGSAGAGRDARPLPRQVAGARWAGADVRTVGDSGAAAADADGGGRQERSEPDGGTKRPGLGPSRRSDTDGRDEAVADTESERGQGVPILVDQGRPLVRTEPRASGGVRAGEPAEGVRVLGRGTGVAWGDYTPAIERWEAILGRPAPPPTDDRGRLSPPFVEWMMGWPQGWVDGLSRTQALKVLGNGVVPLQAATAYRLLLERVEAQGVAA